MEKLYKGQSVIYKPNHLISRYNGLIVKVRTYNKHGNVTIEFIDGPRKGQTRGVKISDLREI